MYLSTINQTDYSGIDNNVYKTITSEQHWTGGIIKLKIIQLAMNPANVFCDLSTSKHTKSWFPMNYILLEKFYSVPFLIEIPNSLKSSNFDGSLAIKISRISSKRGKKNNDVVKLQILTDCWLIAMSQNTFWCQNSIRIMKTNSHQWVQPTKK